MPRRTRAKDLRRKVAVRPQRRTVVVFCEGEASEPDYLNGLRRLPEVHRAAAVDIEISPERGVPLTLVRAAIERNRNEVDECWCVFDVEWPRNHPHLDEAIDLARAHGIRLAVSNPCFELWPILHLDDRQAVSRAAALARRHDADGTSFPDDNPSSTMGDLLSAVERHG